MTAEIHHPPFPTHCSGCGVRLFTGNPSGLCSSCYPEEGHPLGRWASWSEREPEIVISIAPVREDGCTTCEVGPGAYPPGSVASIRLGDTDPDCPLHGRN